MCAADIARTSVNLAAAATAEPATSNGQAQDRPEHGEARRPQPALTPATLAQTTLASPLLAVPVPRFHPAAPAAAPMRPVTHPSHPEPPPTWPPPQHGTPAVAAAPTVAVPLPWRAPPTAAVAASDTSREQAQGSSLAPNAASLLPPQWMAPLPNSRPATSEPRAIPAERLSAQNVPAGLYLKFPSGRVWPDIVHARAEKWSLNCCFRLEIGG